MERLFSNGKPKAKDSPPVAGSADTKQTGSVIIESENQSLEDNNSILLQTGVKNARLKTQKSIMDYNFSYENSSYTDGSTPNSSTSSSQSLEGVIIGDDPNYQHKALELKDSVFASRENRGDHNNTSSDSDNCSREERSNSPSLSSTSDRAQSSIDAVLTLKRTSPAVVHFSETIAKRLCNDDDVTYINLESLSQVVSPKVLESVRHSVKSAGIPTLPRASLGHRDQIFPSPAVEWAERQRKRVKRFSSSRVKSNWRVRKAISSVKSPQDINTYFFKLVNNSEAKDLKMLLELSKIDPSIYVNLDYVDDHERSALRVAIDNRDATVCDVLLKHRIQLGDCLFHAILQNFLPGIEAILKREKCLDMKIAGENYYFPVGVTPMIYAAASNNYKVIKLLYDHGHQLPHAIEWSEGIRLAWESANERRLVCKARSSHAYITFWTEIYHKDPMEYCIKQIHRIREKAELEQEYSKYYECLSNDVENYMCALLDQVQSSEELAQLFRYDFVSYSSAKKALQAYTKGVDKQSNLNSQLKLLETASDERLVNFVTHPNSQLSLAYMRYRYVPYMRRANIVKRIALQLVVGLFFPIWSLIYLVAPNSNIGSLLTLPTISYQCHMTSDVAFVVLNFVSVLLKSPKRDYLGAPPTVLEWLLFFWILGKWLQEIQELVSRGWRKYFFDQWNYTDLAQLSLFSVAIVLRAIDFAQNSGSPIQVQRGRWSPTSPRLLSEIFLSCAYIFFFLRILSLTRADRGLGPLQVSLARMMTNIAQFLSIFILVMLSFGLAMTELYWYYGTPEGKRINCKANNLTSSSIGSNSSVGSKEKNCTLLDIGYSDVGQSLISLFWVIFGQVDFAKLSLAGTHSATETVGRILFAAYHVVVILVLVNMLIAMMSKTYEDTSANEERVWKFHRTAMWIRFIRREVVCPPPMNLIPNPYNFKKYFRFLKMFLWRCCGCFASSELDEVVSHASSEDILELSQFKRTRELNRSRREVPVPVREESQERLKSERPATITRNVSTKRSFVRQVISSDLRKRASKRVMLKLAKRYKYKMFINQSKVELLKNPKPDVVFF